MFTAFGTRLSLVIIPLWLQFLPALPSAVTGFAALEAKTISGQLIVLMVMPMAIGTLLRRAFPLRFAQTAKALRVASIAIAAFVLASIVATIADRISSLFGAILMSYRVVYRERYGAWLTASDR